MTQPKQFPWEMPRHYGPYENIKSTSQILNSKTVNRYPNRGTVKQGYTSSTSTSQNKPGLSNAKPRTSFGKSTQKTYTVKTPNVIYGNKGTMHGRNTTNFVKSKGGASSIVRSGGASLSIMKHGGGGMGNFSK